MRIPHDSRCRSVRRCAAALFAAQPVSSAKRLHARSGEVGPGAAVCCLPEPQLAVLEGNPMAAPATSRFA